MAKLHASAARPRAWPVRRALRLAMRGRQVRWLSPPCRHRRWHFQLRSSRSFASSRLLSMPGRPESAALQKKKLSSPPIWHTSKRSPIQTCSLQIRWRSLSPSRTRSLRAGSGMSAWPSSATSRDRNSVRTMHHRPAATHRRRPDRAVTDPRCTAPSSPQRAHCPPLQHCTDHV